MTLFCVSESIAYLLGDSPRWITIGACRTVTLC